MKRRTYPARARRGFWRRSLTLTVALSLAVSVAVAANPVPAGAVEDPVVDGIGLVDPSTGRWFLRGDAASTTWFYYGNPGDYPIMGDWDCDGIDTPGMYRQSDGFVYLRNSNTQGTADIRFFFGNPGDVPIAGDFNGDGCSTVSIYRPSESRIYVINKLGQNEGGLGAADTSYLFGNPGDMPFVGDFDGDGVETIALHRESTGFVYFRNSHAQGIADSEFYFGDPGDHCVAGDWNGDGMDSPAIFRPSDASFYFRWANAPGVADATLAYGESGWLPVSGVLGTLLPRPAPSPPAPPGAYTAAEIDYFLEVGIGHDSADDWYDEVWKWTHNVRVQVTGSPTAEDMAAVDAVIGDLNRLIDAIEVSLVSANPDILVAIVPSDSFPDYAPGAANDWSDYWEARADSEGAITEATVLIASDLVGQDDRIVLLRYGLSCAMGAMGTSHRFPDSVFYDEWRPVTAYSPMDEAVIRILYDDRVRPLMSGAEVRAAMAS